MCDLKTSETHAACADMDKRQKSIELKHFRIFWLLLFGSQSKTSVAQCGHVLRALQVYNPPAVLQHVLFCGEDKLLLASKTHKICLFLFFCCCNFSHVNEPICTHSTCKPVRWILGLDPAPPPLILLLAVGCLQLSFSLLLLYTPLFVSSLS